MTAKGSGYFTLQDINRLKIIQDVLDGQMKTSRAAEHPGLTSRQCRHLLAIRAPRFCMTVRKHQNIPPIRQQPAIIIRTLKTKGIT